MNTLETEEIESVSKEDVEKNQTEIVELKTTAAKVKSSVDRLTSRMGQQRKE